MKQGPRRVLLTFSALLLVWLLFTFSLDPFSILLGVFFSFIISLFTYDLFVDRESSFKRGIFSFLVFLIRYFFVFLLEIYLASIALVYQVITMRINPGIVKVKTNLRSDFALALLANSITLTPGTVTIDISGQGENLYVHWLTVNTRDEHKIAKKIKGNYESQLRGIFK